MQLCNAKVALANDRNNVLFKQNVTPIEIVLLRQLHGSDAVYDIEVVRDVRWDSKQEQARLFDAYPIHQERIVNLWRDHPGESFPTTVEQLDIAAGQLKSGAMPLEILDAPAASLA